MRRAVTWAGAVTGGLLVLLAVVLAVVVAGSATRPGRAAIERMVPPLSGGMLRVTGLSGWLFGASQIGRLEARDAEGTWLAVDGLTLAWSPLRLLRGQVMVRRIAADRVTVARRPVASGSGASGSGGTAGLPIRVDIAALHIDRLDLAAPVVGQAAGPPVSAPVSPSVSAAPPPSVSAEPSPSVSAPASPPVSAPASPSQQRRLRLRFRRRPHRPPRPRLRWRSTGRRGWTRPTGAACASPCAGWMGRGPTRWTRGSIRPAYTRRCTWRSKPAGWSDRWPRCRRSAPSPPTRPSLDRSARSPPTSG